MTHSNDYFDDMTKAGLSDSQIDSLLRGETLGSPETSDLEVFVANLAVAIEPPIDPSVIGPALAESARGSAPQRGRSRMRRLVVAFAAATLSLLLAGVAVAADDSAPGDPLYSLDIFLEDVGLDPGGVDERLAEFHELIGGGAEGEAIVFLAEYIDGAAGSDVEKAQHHLELAASKTNPSAAAAQEKVAELKEFIETNKGNGVGLDGAEFGKRVSEIAGSKSKNDGNESPADPPGNSEQGPKDGKGPGPPDRAGPEKNK